MEQSRFAQVLHNRYRMALPVEVCDAFGNFDLVRELCVELRHYDANPDYTEAPFGESTVCYRVHSGNICVWWATESELRAHFEALRGIHARLRAFTVDSDPGAVQAVVDEYAGARSAYTYTEVGVYSVLRGFYPMPTSSGDIEALVWRLGVEAINGECDILGLRDDVIQFVGDLMRELEFTDTDKAALRGTWCGEQYEAMGRTFGDFMCRSYVLRNDTWAPGVLERHDCEFSRHFMLVAVAMAEAFAQMNLAHSDYAEYRRGAYEILAAHNLDTFSPSGYIYHSYGSRFDVNSEEARTLVGIAYTIQSRDRISDRVHYFLGNIHYDIPLCRDVFYMLTRLVGARVMMPEDYLFTGVHRTDVPLVLTNPFAHMCSGRSSYIDRYRYNVLRQYEMQQ